MLVHHLKNVLNQIPEPVYWFIELQMWEEMVCRFGHMVEGSGSKKVISIRLCGIAFFTNTPAMGSENGS